jgi:transcriptional regulator with XRE-family HTH domain
MSDWARLGDAIRTRRVELELTQEDVAQAGGPSSALLRSLENKRATTLSRSKRRDLERALMWEPLSIDSVLAGGDPTPQPDFVPDDERQHREVLARLDRIIELLETLTPSPQPHPLRSEAARPEPSRDGDTGSGRASNSP